MPNGNKGLAAALFYMALSPSMAFLNKALLTSYKFNYPFVIMASQMFVTIIILEVLRTLSFINIPKYSFAKGYIFFWPSMFFASNAISSLMALNAMNIPMYGTIKRCGPLVTLLFSVILLKKPCPSSLIVTSVVLISVGAIIAGFGDMTIELQAYVVGTISVFSQACYLTLTQKCAENSMTSLHIMQLNSFNTLPVFCISLISFGELADIRKYHHETISYGFFFIFFMVVFGGAIMNFSMFLCTALNSALTTSLVGVIKSVLQTAIGFFTFGGVKILPLNATGIFMNLFGGVIYTFTKYRESRIRESHFRKQEEANGDNKGIIKQTT